MKIKVISFMLLTSTLISCKIKKLEQKNVEVFSQANNCSVYPHEVDSLHLQTLYDSARWVILTWQCDWPYRPKADSTINKTLGELDLQFDRLIIKSDTIEFKFKYLSGENYVSAGSLKDYIEFITGVAYNTLTHSKIYVSSPNGFYLRTDDPNSRYINSMQPEVIDYIKNNKDKLNICFKEEAIRRKVIN